ncbi:hypothetical protein AC622_14780 [Bacillus sp. FJAT-27916]|uniref:competence protein CoiA n=1 Tax=Bacillaceae TaxID=186817 RepID=UPI0006715DF9|nr:competence protein CoiA family protein [Bacillus sp. FJAT-27916]KMY45331.1 hypothetical protein AC622_14780 [Bacillus sp. FJAT-27916]
MLIAADEEGRLVHSTHLAERKNRIFKCPICQKRVLFKAGSRRIPHFAHQREERCPGMDEPESIIHLEGKNLIYEWALQWAERAVLEQYYHSISQRADIAVHADGLDYAIEFQCSALSAERLIERTMGYQEEGIEPVWIFHLPLLKKKGSMEWSLPASLQSAIRLSPSGDLYLLFFDPQNPKTVLLLRNLIPITKEIFFGQAERLPLKGRTIRQWLRPRARPFLYIREWMRKRESLIRNEWRYQGAKNPLLRSLYSIGIQGMLPKMIGIPLKSSFLYGSAPHHWQGLVFMDLLNCQQKHGEITHWGIRRHFMDRLRKREIVIRSLPSVKIPFFAPVEEYMRFLEKTEYLIKNKENSYIIEEGFLTKEMQHSTINQVVLDFLKEEHNDLWRN